MTGASELPPRRRDELSEWHDLRADHCPDCGCTIYRAADDAGIIWEPERAWDEGCRDRGCHCHTAALIGARRD